MSHQASVSTRRPLISRGLVALNVGLVVALAGVTLGSSATAQDDSSRDRGRYALVGGGLQSGNSNGVYVLDSANQELILLRFDASRNELQGLAFRDVKADNDAKPGR